MFSWVRGEQEGRGRHRKREVRRLSQEIWSQRARGWGSCACWVGFPEMCTLSYSFHSGFGLLFLAGQTAGCLDQSAAPFCPSLQHTPSSCNASNSGLLSGGALTLQVPLEEPEPGPQLVATV